MAEYENTEVPLKNLLLDPNNYRFASPDKKDIVDDRRIENPRIQDEVFSEIMKDDIKELIKSIKQNGFIPIERIIVRPLNDNESKYVVIEGNRRTAALKTLYSLHEKRALSDSFDVSIFENVPVTILHKGTDSDYLSIMGIRHVGGLKAWGGYQGALLVYELLNMDNLSTKEVSERLGLSVGQTNRRNKAFMVLNQMREDEEYGEEVTEEMYPIFHEIMAKPQLREWLDHNKDTLLFDNDENREVLYGWLISTEGKEPKLTSSEQARKLGKIISNTDVFDQLINDELTIDEANTVLQAEGIAMAWKQDIRKAYRSLKDISLESIQSMSKEDISLMKDMQDRIAILLKMQTAIESDGIE